MLIRTLVGFGIYFAASVASAEFIDGQKLKEMLDAQVRIYRGDIRSGDYQDSARANGYVLGVVGTVIYILIRPREGVKAGQLTAMVKSI